MADDVIISLGDPDAHTHAWSSVGIDDGGAHDLVCDCGATGSGYGEFPVKD